MASSCKTPSTNQEIIAVIERMADAQIALYRAEGAFPAIWIAGAFYVGLARLTRASENPKYLRTMEEIARRHAWKFQSHDVGPDPDFVAHADNQCVGQMYLELAAHLHDVSRLEAMRKQLDEVIVGFENHTDRTRLTWRNRLDRDALSLPWWWCDALFMAPPVFTRLSAMTGDRKYIDAMDKQWWITAGHLYDKEERLFFRDNRYPTQRTPNGKKIFWGRGNGWVIAGLANVLTYMPQNYPSRPRYEDLFKEMAQSLKALQQSDGLWRGSLADPQASPYPETSGSGFFCFALAWGVNHGLLDGALFAPVARKAWAALNERIRPDGLIGWVQKVGDEPDSTEANFSMPYAVGAFILAGAEMLGLPAAGAELPRCMARYVPERDDDIFWENDRIGHRIYGPALAVDPAERLTSSGMNVWVKSVRNLFMNKALRIGRYHEDQGEGLDCYNTGDSRGCGGLGIWDDAQQKLLVSGNWADYRILQNGPDLAAFRVVYADWDAGGGRKVRETRSFSLPAGSNLTRMISTLDSDSPGDLLVGIGLARRTADGKGFVGQEHLLTDKERGILAYWEPEQAGKGTTGCAVLVDPRAIVKFTSDAKNHLIIIKATPGRPFVYYAGACWDKGRDFHNWPQWEAYVKAFQPDFDP